VKYKPCGIENTVLELEGEETSVSSIRHSNISRGIWILAILAAMGGFLDSYDLISIGSATVIAQKYHALSLTSYDVASLNAMAFAGAILAALIGGRLSDKLGRRAIFILDLALFVVAGLLQAVVTNTIELLVLRFLIGVAIGLDIPVAWTMICESAPTIHRGRLVSLMFTFWALGGLVSYIVAILLLPLGSMSWRILLASSAIPAVIVFYFRRDMPESPRWLLLKNRTTEASAASARLGIEGLTDISPSTSSTPNSSEGFSELFRTFWRPALFEGVLMFVFSGTGILVSLYPPRIFSLIAHVAFTQSLYIGGLAWIIILLAMITAVWLIDRIGRLPLAYIGSLGVAILLILLAVAPDTNVAVFLPLFLVFAYIEVLGAWAPGWVYQSEVFPTKIRGTGAGFSGALNRIGAGVAAFGVPVFIAAFGFQPLLYVFAIANLILFVVLLIFAVETKRLSLEEIESKVTSPKNSRKKSRLSRSES
jgi:putative MFS transporter